MNPSTLGIRILPSVPAAIMAGAVGMPVFVLGWKFLEASLQSPAVVVLWFIIGFFAPLLVATADLQYAARRRRELGGFFRPLASPDDFRLFYFPAWRRMFVWFISAATSLLVLKAFGLEF
jgi:hypothetical protein